MNPQPISRSFANSPAHTPSPAHQGALSPASDGQQPPLQPASSSHPQSIQQQQFHVQHPFPPNGNSAYERQNSSYLDTLSESPSFSFLSPATDEPYNPAPKSSGFDDGIQSLQQQQQQSHGARYGVPNPGYGPVRSRTATQNGSIFDDLQPAFPHHRDRFERENGIPYGNVIRNNSVVANGVPNGVPPSSNGSQYGMGAFSPEMQHQDLVHKLMQEHQAQQARQHQQAIQAMQQQQQQQQQRQMHAQEAQRQQQQQQQIPLAQPQPQLTPMNAQALLNSLPGNKEYNYAIQQHLQNAQLAAQMNSQMPNLANLVSNLNLAGLGNVPANGGGSSSQEEISTIFVVGFPDDMQEREFQNMFTFCPGFEAATLKVPSKELSLFGAVGANTQSVQVQQAQQVAAANALRSAGLLPGHPASDPYNLLTTNSGGVVLDSRDLWSQSAIDGLTDLAGVLNNVATPAQAPRKQIIGFAKFKTRQEALDAREILQGRRVDMEKGSMLKAEMAKKNLHTKRGVGPLTSGTGAAASGGAAPNGNAQGQAANGASLESLIQQLTQVPGLNGLAGLAALQQQVQQQQAHQQVQQQQSPSAMESLTPRDRETAALAAMGLNGAPGREKERDRQMQEDREFDNFSPNRGRPGDFGAYQAWNSVPASNPSLPQKPTTYLPPTGSATFTPGITPALPAASPAVIGSSSSQQLLDHLSLGTRHASSYTGANGLINGSSGGGSSNSSGGFGNGLETNAWSPFGGAVDPLDTSGGLGPGPSSVVGGPTSSSNSGSHALSRKPSTSMQEHSPSEQVASYSISANGTSTSSPLSPTGGPFEMAPAVPQGLPSGGVSPTTHQAPPTMTYGPNGGVSGILPGRREKAPTSSKDSAGSSSPPEQNQQTAPNSASPVDTMFDTSDFANAMAGMNIRDDLNGGASFNASSARANAADQNPPINTLYVGNLPTINQAQPNHLEDSLRSLFSRCVGYRKLCFRQKTNGPMCFVEFDDVPHASKALNELYGNTVNGLVKGGIRLSFSKNPLGVRTPSLSTGPGSLAVGSMFPAPLSGLAESRFPGGSQPLPTRHASMSAGSFANDIGLPRNTRQDSMDPLSPSMYGSFSFNSRPFSPPTSNLSHRPQPVGRPTPQNAFQPPPTQLSMHSQHQSIFDNPSIHHQPGMNDPRDVHAGLFSAAVNPNPSGGSPAPQPGVEA